MKRLISVILLLLILSPLVLYAYADFENEPIVDEDGYLMQSELQKLSEKLEDLREEYNFDAAIYIETYMSGETAETSADDIYDYGGYGFGQNADGIMLYICTDTREYHFTTHGYGRTAFNSNGLKYLEGKVLPYLKEDDYYKAFDVYADTCFELLEMAKNGEPYNEKQYSTKYFIGVIAVCILAPLIIAYFMMKNKLRKMNTVRKDNYAASYMKDSGLKLNVSKDLFLYSNTVRTKREKSSSGTHTSSSGRTHGGRGGSF